MVLDRFLFVISQERERFNFSCVFQFICKPYRNVFNIAFLLYEIWYSSLSTLYGAKLPKFISLAAGNPSADAIPIASTTT